MGKNIVFIVSIITALSFSYYYIFFDEKTVSSVINTEENTIDTKLIQKFENHYKNDTHFEYIEELTESDALYLADNLKHHKDVNISFFAADIYIKYGYIEKAIPIMANIMVHSSDDNGIMYYMVHEYDYEILARVLKESFWYILHNLDKYNSPSDIEKIYGMYVSVNTTSSEPDYELDKINPIIIDNLIEKYNGINN